MPKYIDKMNLPQYKYFNDMLGQDEGRKQLISTAMTGVHMVKMGRRRERSEGFMMLAKARKELPEFLYRCEEDQKRCRLDLSVSDFRQLEKKMDRYLGILLILPFFQGDIMEKEILAEEDSLLFREHYNYDKDTGKYKALCTSTPKLLLVSEELFQNYYTGEYIGENTAEELGGLISKDVNYVIFVQGSAQQEAVYLAEKNDGLFLHVLDRKMGTSKLTMEKALEHNKEMRAVLLCLRDYLQKMEQSEQLRRKYKQEHPEKKEREKKRHIYEHYEDKNAIKIFDIKEFSDLPGYAGVCCLQRKRSGTYGKRGYEMLPHTRKGHYRTYKNGKTIYVKSAVIHKEKYTGVQSAHRMNQMEPRIKRQEEQIESAFTQGMGM